jgi:hypothetical protein
MQISLTCPGCGKRLSVSESIGRRKIQCPACGVYCTADVQDIEAARYRELPGATPIDSKREAAAKVDEGGSYNLVQSRERTCPGCRRPLAPDAVLCVACGFDLKSGKKRVRKEFEPVAYRWQAGWSFAGRMMVCLLPHAVILPMAALAVVLHRDVLFVLIPWLFFSVLMAFLVGTYEQADLARDERGKVRLERMWRV